MTTEVLVDEKSIAKYLLDNPAFFKRQEETLKNIQLNLDDGRVVSLLEKQIYLLRRDHQALQAKFIDTLQMASENEKLLTRVHRITLTLLDGHNLCDLCRTLAWQLRENLGIDGVKLILNRDFFSDFISEFASLRSASYIQEYIERLEAVNRKTLCGASDRSANQQFFSGNEYRSMAWSRVTLDEHEHARNLGLLVLGSKKKDKFISSDGTLFVDLLCDMLAKLLSQLEKRRSDNTLKPVKTNPVKT